jgi:NAD(P)H-hydrate epimerase
MGDVLTGVCAGLAGRELSMFDAGRIGAWICGRAAEMSIFEHGASEESLVASDVLANLGEAFTELRNSSV